MRVKMPVNPGSASGMHSPTGKVWHHVRMCHQVVVCIPRLCRRAREEIGRLALVTPCGALVVVSVWCADLAGVWLGTAGC